MADLTEAEAAAAAAREEEARRLRKARREAKIKAGAGDRLNRITGLASGVPRDPPPTTIIRSSSSSVGSSSGEQVTAPAAAATTTTTTTTTATATDQQQQPQQQPRAKTHPDPAEVDISQHFYQPQPTPRIPRGQNYDGPVLDDAQLRRMMLGFDTPSSSLASARGTPTLPGAGAGAGAGAGPAGPAAAAAGPGLGGGLGVGAPGQEEDPMLKLMMQMLGGGAAGPGGPGAAGGNPFAGLGAAVPPPPGVAGVGAGGVGQQAQQAQAQAGNNNNNNNKGSVIWKVLHTLTALALALYIAFFTPFNGSKLAREQAALGIITLSSSSSSSSSPSEEDETKRRKTFFYFYAFATAEALLLGTRWFVDRGGRSRLDAAGSSGQGTGLVGALAGFLPPHLKARVELVMRYAEVWATVRGDVLVCVFVLGVVAWWRG